MGVSEKCVKAVFAISVMGSVVSGVISGVIGSVLKHLWRSAMQACVWIVLSTVVTAQEDTGYKLALGDVVSINVFDEPDLSFDRVLITDNGKIAFPFIGEVQATGRTPIQIQQAIVAALKPDYLIEPKVTVSIVEYRPFFMTGEVEKPGSIPYQPGLTLRQAITIAGGLTERASASKITVVSGGNGTEPQRVDLNYEVKPGDTITVGESFF